MDSKVLAILALLVSIFTLILTISLGCIGGWAYYRVRHESPARPVAVSSASGAGSSGPIADISELEARTAGSESRQDETWGDLGDAYLAAGRREDAIRAFRQAYELDASDSEWSMKLQNLGDGAFLAERNTRRIPELEALAAGSDARNDEIWGDLGDAYRSAGRAEDAIRAYRKARELDPDDNEWRNALQALGDQGNP